MSKTGKELSYIIEIKQILSQARQKAYSAVNSAMVEAYWLTGKRLVEEEQNGNKRAEYGDEIIKLVSQELTQEFGKGFSLTNLKNFKKFYLTFNDLEKGQTLSDQSTNWEKPFAKLSWSHFERLIRVTHTDARNWYLKEAVEQNWSVRTLDRNISTLYYQRLLSSQKKELVINEMTTNTASIEQNPEDFIKNPAVLDFLNLPTNKYSPYKL